MTPEQFMYWLKGYLSAHIDSQMKLDIEKALAQVGERAKSSNPGTTTPIQPFTPWRSMPGDDPITTAPYNPYWYEQSTTTWSGKKKEVLND